MNASDLDEEPVKTPTARDWLRLAGAAIGLVLLIALFTFWF